MLKIVISADVLLFDIDKSDNINGCDLALMVSYRIEPHGKKTFHASALHKKAVWVVPYRFCAETYFTISMYPLRVSAFMLTLLREVL